MVNSTENGTDKTDGTKPNLGKIGNEKIDDRLDKEILLEFGGPTGVTAMMIFFPFLMYYFWVCLEYHEGKLLVPTAFTYEAIKYAVYDEFWVKITTDAFPTVYAAQIYIGSTLLSAIFAYVMPGPVIQGLPVPSLNGQRVCIPRFVFKLGNI